MFALNSTSKYACARDLLSLSSLHTRTQISRPAAGSLHPACERAESVFSVAAARAPSQGKPHSLRHMWGGWDTRVVFPPETAGRESARAHGSQKGLSFNPNRKERLHQREVHTTNASVFGHLVCASLICN